MSYRDVTTADHVILVNREILPDESFVYSVVFGKATIRTNCRSDAMLIADRIASAINDHSWDTAEVVPPPIMTFD